jgi:hypothetical protein
VCHLPPVMLVRDTPPPAPPAPTENSSANIARSDPAAWGKGMPSTLILTSFCKDIRPRQRQRQRQRRRRQIAYGSSAADVCFALLDPLGRTAVSAGDTPLGCNLFADHRALVRDRPHDTSTAGGGQDAAINSYRNNSRRRDWQGSSSLALVGKPGCSVLLPLAQFARASETCSSPLLPATPDPIGPVSLPATLTFHGSTHPLRLRRGFP